MSNAVAGRQTVHRFTVLGLNKLPAAADDISVVSSRAILATQPDLTHSVSIVDGSFAVTVALPDDSAGLDFDIYALVDVQGVETEFTANLGIVSADIEARLDAQDECLKEIKEVAGAVTGTVTLPDASDVAAGVNRGDGVLGTATTLASNLPPSSDVRLGVNRGDGVLGTLQDFSVPDPDASTLEFMQFDDYDGVCKARKSWTTRKDLTGKTVTLLVFDKHDQSRVAGRFAGVVESPALVSVAASAEFDFDLEFCGCPPTAELAFALVASSGGSEATIEQGRVFVYGRPTVAP